MKWEFKKMNGIDLFTKEWFVVVVGISTVMIIILALIGDGIIKLP